MRRKATDAGKRGADVYKHMSALFAQDTCVRCPHPAPRPLPSLPPHLFARGDVLDSPRHKGHAFPPHSGVGGVIIGVVEQVQQRQQHPAEDVGVVRQQEGVGGDLGEGWVDGAEKGEGQSGPVRT